MSRRRCSRAWQRSSFGRGCVLEEVLRLRKADFLRDARGGGWIQVHLGKTPAARRRLRLHEMVVRILDRQMQTPGPWMFPAAKNSERPTFRVNNPNARVCQKTQLDITLYDFRHTFATRLSELNTPLSTIAALMGHASTRLARYIHPTQPHQDEAMRLYEASLPKKKGILYCDE